MINPARESFLRRGYLFKTNQQRVGVKTVSFLKLSDKGVFLASIIPKRFIGKLTYSLINRNDKYEKWRPR
jgi:hypothetical protein